jgi:isoleucyl-tRNA synthetase
VGHQVTGRIEVVEIGDEDAAGVADLAVQIHHTRQDLLADAQLLGELGHRHPQADDLGAALLDDLLRHDGVPHRLRHLAAFEVDRFALARYADASTRMLKAYDDYDFSTVTQALNGLITVDLSAFYVDVTKDRMYTLGPRSHARRSTQTAMYLICDGLARLLAPILPVTADDLWRHLPGTHPESVHLETFARADRFEDAALSERWERLLKVREDVNAALEQKRKDKVIGNSLTAHVTVTSQGGIGQLLEQYRNELPMLFIVSDFELNVGAADVADHVAVDVDKARGVKCERCWRFVPTTREEPDWAGICDRCVDALAEPAHR